MKKEYLYGIIGLLAGVLITILFTSSVVNSNNTGMMRMMGFTTNVQERISSTSDVIDAHFIEQMIPHHEDAITMAQLAPERSNREETKTLSENIIDSQSREITQMKQWYRQWFGRDVPADTQVMGEHGMMGNSGMHMGMMGGDNDIETLENTPDFDREFIEQMIPHHQMAVMMANMLKNSSDRSEMQKLADDIITAQTNEIDQMRSWYREWGY